jgi:hypothetical protein
MELSAILTVAPEKELKAGTSGGEDRNEEWA